MKFSIITIFPELIRNFLNFGLLAKAMQKGLLEVEVHDLREFSRDKHRKVDDRPLGGGPGMVLMPDPLFRAVEHVKEGGNGRVILFSAYGRILEQKKVKKLAAAGHLILICGRYEGVDQRVVERFVDYEVSVGDYVLSGGEIPAAVIIDAVVRLIPGALGDEQSALSDSFQDDLLAPPVYTRPAEFMGWKVPDILLSGHSANIEKWRHEQSVERTRKLRPEMLEEDEA